MTAPCVLSLSRRSGWVQRDATDPSGAVLQLALPVLIGLPGAFRTEAGSANVHHQSYDVRSK